MTSHPTARLDIDLTALLHNYRALQRQCLGAEVAPVVKADAYGLGVAAVAPYLAKHGARTFFVARLDEGIALRRSLSDAVIYVLDGLAGDPQAFAVHGLRPVLNSAEHYRLWLDGPDTVQAALHIDTGMNRLGVRPEDVAALPKTRPLSLVMSHLACGDERKLLVPLPLVALRLPSGTVASLARVGLKRIGDIIDLPRSPLTARFGSDVLRQLDRALGQEHEPLNPRLPVAPYVAEQRFAEPIAREEDVLKTIERLAGRLKIALERRGEVPGKALPRKFSRTTRNRTRNFPLAAQSIRERPP